MEMIDPVKALATAPPPSADRQTSSPPPASLKPQVQDQPLRLVVEPKTGAQGYTYKLFDRVTGQLLIELPREEASRIGGDPTYAAGQVLNAKA